MSKKQKINEKKELQKKPRTLRIECDKDFKLEEVLKRISKLRTEVTINATPKELIIELMDDASVVYSKTVIKPEAFIEYECNQDIKIVVDIALLITMLDKVKTKRITLKDNELMIGSLQGENYTLPLIDTNQSMQEVNISKVSESLTKPIIIETSALRKAIENAELVSEALFFKIRENGNLSLIGDGESLMGYNKTIENENKLATHEEVKSKYSVEYLKKVVRKSKESISDELEISMNNDHPLLIREKNHKAEIISMLAPRIDTD